MLQVVPSTVDAEGTYSISKSWLFRYSLDGHEHRIGLGPFDKLPLNKARVKADGLREMVDQKIDPLERKREQRDERERKRKARKGVTFRQCAEQYIAAHAPGWKGKLYKDQWEDTLERFVYPVVGEMHVAKVDEALVLQILEPIWNEKTTTAKVLRARIARILGWAAAKPRCYRPAGPNPATWRDNLQHSLAKPDEVSPVEHHAALDHEKVPAFITALRKDPGTAARALEFMILTAVRTGEVRGAIWAEIDLEKRLWTIPQERMKMRGKQDRGDHVVPLSDAAVAILEAIRGDEIPDWNALVFKGRFGTRLAEGGLRCVCRRIDPTITVHGFRSTFSDWAGDETDASEETREFCLAHVKKGVAAAYRHKKSVAKRRALMQQWADFCNGVASDNVVLLQQTA
jgi:integrase